jgi:cytochrome-b5 reductase
MNSKAPIPPEPHECCGNGCEPCVWDLYREALRQWQATQQSLSEPASNADTNHCLLDSHKLKNPCLN